MAKERQPKHLLLENVRGLLSHDEGRTFGTILKTLWDIGYNVEWQVLNSKDFGVPQNRERIFIIGHLRGQSRPKVFPIRRKNKRSIKQSGNIVDDTDINFKNPQRGRVYSPEGISPTLNTSEGGYRKPMIKVRACLTPARINKRQNGRRFKEDGEPSFTLTKQDIHSIAVKKIKNNEIINPLKDKTNRSWFFEQQVYSGEGITRALKASGGSGNMAKIILSNEQNYEGVTKDYQIRKLTPLEYFRLQGFPDEWYYKCREEGISDTQMYRAAGDAVTVNVVQEIGRRLKESLK